MKHSWNFVDITNNKYNHLTVIGFHHKDSHGNMYWECKCDCGNTCVVGAGHLKTGHTKTCGCDEYNKRITHSDTHTKLYRIWAAMKSRCNNPSNTCYPYYGAKGVTYSEEWEKYEPFKEWAMNNGYKKGLSIDRIDNSKGYYPENCRWVTLSEQANNKTTNVMVTLNGETHTFTEWCRILGINIAKARSRYEKYGWTIEETFELVERKPVRKRKVV